MIPLALLIIYCVVVFFALVWCENTYHDSKPVYKAGEPLQSGSLSTKRGTLQSGSLSTKRGTLQSGGLYKAGACLQSGGLYKAGDSTKREASPLSQPPQVAQAP